MPLSEQRSRSARAADGSGGANPSRARMSSGEGAHALGGTPVPSLRARCNAARGRYSCPLPSRTWKAGTIRGSPGGGDLVEIFRGGGSPAGSGRADSLPALFYFDSRTAPGCALAAPAPPPPRGHPCPGPRRTSLCREGARRALTSRREAARGGRGGGPRPGTPRRARSEGWTGLGGRPPSVIYDRSPIPLAGSGSPRSHRDPVPAPPAASALGKAPPGALPHRHGGYRVPPAPPAPIRQTDVRTEGGKEGIPASGRK